MVKIKIHIGDDIIKSLLANRGDNLQLVLVANEIFIPSDCGGRGTCGKCTVKLLAGDVNCPVDNNGNFLSCQCNLISDIEIQINDISLGYGLTDFKSQKFNIIPKNGYGLAVDIGTTTIAYYLLDLKSGKLIDKISEFNKQITYGADILSRISNSKGEKYKQLHQIIIKQINNAIKRFTKNNKIKKIKKTIIAGNTTMLHFVANVSPFSMGTYPFKPKFTKCKNYIGSEIGINSDKVILMPSVSAFIGSDIVAGVLTNDTMQDKSKITLFIDIGTNGEIVLNNKGKHFACSTAAGPAFEGAKIEKGMANVSGAINHIKYNNYKLNYTIIDNENAKGICGSGLIDIVAILLENKIIDKTGLMTDNFNSPLSKNFKNGKFFITDDIFITQRDIREIQLAKSAIMSGILALCKTCNTNLSEIENVFIAGGFGFCLNLQNAYTVGILPKQFRGKCYALGNSSGKGAIMCLLNENKIVESNKISNNIKVIELAQNADFQKNYIEQLNFD